MKQFNLLFFVALICFVGHTLGQSSSCTIDYSKTRQWGSMCDGQWSTCSSGKAQSPISIDTKRAIEDVNLVTTLKFEPAFPKAFNRSGLARIDIIPSSDSSLVGGPLGGRHFLTHMTFRSPSEHAFDDFRASASAQFWFYDARAKNSVVMDLMFVDNTEEPNVWLENVLNAVRKNLTTVDLTPKYAFPSDLTYYFYSGSNVVPPCEEGWTWMVIRKPVPATLAQISAIRHWQGTDNTRPLQPLYGRNVTLEYSDILVQEDPNTFIAVITVFTLMCLVGGIMAIFMQREIAEKEEARKALQISRTASHSHY